MKAGTAAHFSSPSSPVHPFLSAFPFSLFVSKIGNMKIRERLLLGFWMYVLIFVVCGFFAYKDLRKISARLNLVEISDDITNTILEVRRYEKNYLLYKDDGSLSEVQKYLGLLKKGMDDIRPEIAAEVGTDRYEMMKKRIAEYEVLFARVAADTKAQEKLLSRVREQGRRIGQVLDGKKLREFLVLRRLEKNLVLYRDQASYDAFMKIYGELKSENGVEGYGILMMELYGLYGDERKSTELVRLKAREIQSFTENLSRKERADIGATLKSSVSILGATLVVVIFLGTLINMKLAKYIAAPIRRLERITNKVAEGDFSEAIVVKGGDEIASLEMSFNQMEEKLKQTMTSLEETVNVLKEKQARLVEAEKLASIGKLAAGIAHEINNPLTSILTFSSLMLEQTPPGDGRYERLRMIVRETTRARNIVRQVLSFAREAPLRVTKLNVNQPVTEIVDSLIAQEAFEGIDLKLDLSDDLPIIPIDPVQIGQVALNILMNAVHAITPPGKIEVSTRKTGGFVEVVFRDSGGGIAEEHIEKIFDPFFTTKDKTKGTGLGLAVSYGIIKKHGGTIEVQSKVGEGTTFIVRLPADE